jgi:hypothetical protein
VLRAFHEAGVRIDLVAGRGIGMVGALFAAVDLAPKLWDERGLWSQRRDLTRLYRWQRPWRLVAATLVVLAAMLMLPVAGLAVAAVTYPLALVVQLAGGSGGATLAERVSGVALALQRPDWYGVWVPRLVTLTVVAFVVGLAALGLRRRSDSAGALRREALAWRLLGAPLDADVAARWVTRGFWGFLRGAVTLPEPRAADLSRRYVDLLRDSLGQPGYRELMLIAHDLDARRDLVFALLAEPYRQSFFADPSDRGVELVDLAGVGSGDLVTAIRTGLSVPLLTEPAVIRFALEGYWRGEAHRLYDRPEAIARLLEELSAAGVEQVILASADPRPSGPHALRPSFLDPRARAGEWQASSESAAVRDATTALFDRFSALFHIRPSHNPLGPFAFAGTYDRQSDRRFELVELMARGYEDTYRQFVEAVVGAEGGD